MTLDHLLTSVAPYVSAAVAEAPHTRLTPTARLYPSPLRIEIAFRDGRGFVRRVWGADVWAIPRATRLTRLAVSAGVPTLGATR